MQTHSRRRIAFGAAAAIGSALLLSACVADPGPYEGPRADAIIVREPPPPLRAETRPVYQGSGSWNPGHWHWNGRQYVWVEGRYVERPHQRDRAVWVPGRWVQRGFGWVWVEGHWRG